MFYTKVDVFSEEVIKVVCSPSLRVGQSSGTQVKEGPGLSLLTKLLLKNILLQTVETKSSTLYIWELLKGI